MATISRRRSRRRRQEAGGGGGGKGKGRKTCQRSSRFKKWEEIQENGKEILED